MSELYENIIKCFAYLSIILELSKGRRITGYDILIHVKSFGLEVSPGTVYHQLAMLENAGIIKGKTRKRTHTDKTVYEMTEKGLTIFKEFKEKWTKPLRYAYENIVG